MSEKFGGFRTTGIWVMFKYLIPVALFAGAVMYFSPQSRNTAVAAVHATLGQVVDLSQVPGLGAGVPAQGIAGLDDSPPPPPPEGGFLFRTFGIGKPVVSDDTPRVRLSDLPSTGQPNVIRLSDLPQPTETIAYRLNTRENRPAPKVYASPRPRPMPTEAELAYALANAPQNGDGGILGLWDSLTATALRKP